MRLCFAGVRRLVEFTRTLLAARGVVRALADKKMHFLSGKYFLSKNGASAGIENSLDSFAHKHSSHCWVGISMCAQTVGIAIAKGVIPTWSSPSKIRERQRRFAANEPTCRRFRTHAWRLLSVRRGFR